ncbi:MAG: sulfotransferase [Planctomycetes bacterium]|nr:sulfotransferase [Planctomycetota bacterium]
MPTLKPPIILVANARSGTTMTSQCFKMLDSQIKILREKRMIWTVGNTLHPDDRFTADMATKRVIKKIRQTFLDLQQEHGGRQIMEKTPSNCLRIPYIRAIFPEAIIIHMIRDGRDNISSCLPFWTRPRKKKRILRRLKETPMWQWPIFIPRAVRDQIGIRMGLTKRVKSWGVIYPGMFEDLQQMDLIEVIAHQWVNAVETALEDLDQSRPEVFVEWRYEELVADPLGHFSRFLDVAGLEMTERLATYLRDEIHTQSSGAWKKRLTAEQVSKILPIITPTMRKVGYPVDADSADHQDEPQAGTNPESAAAVSPATT